MQRERHCYRCGTDIGRLERVGRRDRCLTCDADLHCCRNCQFYDPTRNNHCREPQAERQVEKEAGNFCDFFAFVVGVRSAGNDGTGKTAKDKLAELFRKKAI